MKHIFDSYSTILCFVYFGFFSFQIRIKIFVHYGLWMLKCCKRYKHFVIIKLFCFIQVWRTEIRVIRVSPEPTGPEPRCSNSNRLPSSSSSNRYFSISSSCNSSNSCSSYSNTKCNSNSFTSNRYLSKSLLRKTNEKTKTKFILSRS